MLNAAYNPTGFENRSISELKKVPAEIIIILMVKFLESA